MHAWIILQLMYGPWLTQFHVTRKMLSAGLTDILQYNCFN